jgi:hypothetical protein
MQTDTLKCDHCTRPARYRFSATPGATPALRCWLHGLVYGPVVQRALQVAAVVGTILFVINQLDVVLSGKVTPVVLLKIVLTYLVPFLVATYSALAINVLHTAKAVPSRIPPTTPGATT